MPFKPGFFLRNKSGAELALPRCLSDSIDAKVVRKAVVRMRGEWFWIKRQGKRFRVLRILSLGGLLLSIAVFHGTSPAHADTVAQRFAHNAPDIPFGTLTAALRSVQRAVSREEPAPDYLAVVDFSLPSTTKRFWLFDYPSQRLLLQDWVAHGRGSGEQMAVRFSNESGSKASSLGLYRCADPYVGQHGYSMRLIGLDPGVNDRAADRAIVLHGADYVSPEFIARHGRLGRSWGCPALSVEGARTAITYMERGRALLFVYYPEAGLEEQS